MIVASEPRPWLEDAVLLLALGVIVFVHPGAALAVPLAVAIVVALGWGYATLHVPSRVEITSEGVTFSRYRRTHTFAWRDVERLRLRRFLVSDRVLLRLSPAPPWRGRYWLRDSLRGYDALVRELESRK
jgi:hypothetical protein